MSTISNRFYVTALQDGTTLHGNLVSDKTLTQAWNGNAAVPNWKGTGTAGTADSPTIWLTLFSGATLVAPSNTFTWRYNGVAITNEDTRFVITTKSVTYGTDTVSMPALKIVDNLASSSNVDIDTITFEGSYVISGSSIDFMAEAQVRISTITKGSDIGVINFVNGVTDITTTGQNITMYGVLYGGDNGGVVQNFTTKWYLNDAVVGTNGTTIDGQANAFRVNESQVVDHATIRCEFYVGADLKYTAYAGVDDMQDPEFMYVQYNGNNGNAASLRKTEHVPFVIWVGTRTDPTPIGGSSNPTYNTIKVKLLDGNGDTITATGLAIQIPNPDANGWRDLTSTMSGGKATIDIHYDTVNGVGKKNLTGIILASTSN